MRVDAATRGMTTTSPDVTILISSYNQVEFLPEAIASALGQTVPSSVIVVDDGSSDGSADFAERAGVRTVRLPHRGALETFRSAVELVETPFHCLLNGDDALEPTYLERTRLAMDDPRVGFVYTGVRYTGARREIVRPRPFDSRALRWSNFAHGASLVRKSAYDSVGGYDRMFAEHSEDWALWVAMVVAGWTGARVDEALLRYRRYSSGGRDPTSAAEFERTRWRLAKRHPRFYGPAGFVRLALSSMKRRAGGI